MNKLLTFLFGAVPALIASFVGAQGRKWITLTAAYAALAAITLAFIAAINTCIGEIGPSLVAPSWIGNAVGMFVPSNFGQVFACVISAHIGRGAYDFAVGKVRMFNQAT